MTARQAAEYVYGLMQKAGWPYVSPEMDTPIENCPPLIRVWDDRMQMIRVISFAANESEAAEALAFSRDNVNTMDHPEQGWPEAWYFEGRTAKRIEGWDSPAPAE